MDFQLIKGSVYQGLNLFFLKKKRKRKKGKILERKEIYTHNIEITINS